MSYDFSFEAGRVCDAIGSDNGRMTVQCALREAYAAGVAAPAAAPAPPEPLDKPTFFCTGCGKHHRGPVCYPAPAQAESWQPKLQAIVNRMRKYADRDDDCYVIDTWADEIEALLPSSASDAEPE